MRLLRALEPNDSGIKCCPVLNAAFFFNLDCREATDKRELSRFVVVCISTISFFLVVTSASLRREALKLMPTSELLTDFRPSSTLNWNYFSRLSDCLLLSEWSRDLYESLYEIDLLCRPTNISSSSCSFYFSVILCI